MASHARKASHEPASRLDRVWRNVLRALPANEGQFLKETLDDDESVAEDINEVFLKFRDRCDELLNDDLEYAVDIMAPDGVRTIPLEEHLWSTHTHVNAWYRRQREILASSRGKHVVAVRELRRRFLQFVKASQLYYRLHVSRLAARADGLPELEAVARKVTVQNQGERQNVPDESEVLTGHAAHSVESSRFSQQTLPPGQHSSALESCFVALLHLGDLHRWQEEARIDGETNYSPAVGFYDLASVLNPNSGIPHHQLAVIETLASEPDDLRILYHLYRSLATEHPHPKAAENLKQHSQKIMSRPMPQTAPPALPGQRESDARKQTLSDLVTWFSTIHAKCVASPSFEDYEALEKSVVGYLKNNIDNMNITSVLKKIVLVNIASDWVAREKYENLKECPNDVQLARFLFLKLNVRTMSTIFEQFKWELSHAEMGMHLTRPLPQTAANMVSPKLHRLLPVLVNYSSWLVTSAELFSTVTGDVAFFEGFTNAVDFLWVQYTEALTKLVSMFVPKDIPEIMYMLEEDEETLGFKPFQDMNLRYRYILNDMRRVEPGLAERLHPTQEMLSRIGRLIKDGLKVASFKSVPIEYGKGTNNYCFRFCTVDQQPILLASPSQRQARQLAEAAGLPPQRPRSQGSDKSSGSEGQRRREEYKEEIDRLVELGGPRGTQFQLYPARTRTPLAFTFEDELDINPFREATPSESSEGMVATAGTSVLAAPGGSATLYHPRPQHAGPSVAAQLDPEVVANEAQMRWLETEIGRVAEPVTWPGQYGRTG